MSEENRGVTLKTSPQSDWKDACPKNSVRVDRPCVKRYSLTVDAGRSNRQQ